MSFHINNEAKGQLCCSLLGVSSVMARCLCSGGRPPEAGWTLTWVLQCHHGNLNDHAQHTENNTGNIALKDVLFLHEWIFLKICYLVYHQNKLTSLFPTGK